MTKQSRKTGSPRSRRSLAMTVLALAMTVLCALPQAARAQLCSTPTTNGLVGHWELEDTNTTVTATVGPNGTMSGGLSGATDSTTGVAGNALHLDGVDDSIDLGKTGIVNNIFGTGGTLTAWYWIDPSAAGYRIFDKDSVGAGYLFTNNGLFEMKNGSNIGRWQAPALPVEKWVHLAVVYDVSSTANDPQIYYNGVAQTVTETTAPTGTGTDDSAQDLNIGNRADLARSLLGNIDDVRIYNRVLSDEEIAELYEYGHGDRGSFVYDQRHASLKYCNGTNWVHAGTGSYIPNAVVFDGASTYLTRGSDFTSNADSKKVSGSFWFRTAGTGVYFILDNAQNKFNININASGSMDIKAGNAAATNILSVRANGGVYNDGTWHHAIFSFDMSDTGKRHLYIDGISDLGLVNKYTDDTIDFTVSNYWIGTTENATAYFFDGDMADVWIDFGTYIDLSLEANRRKFTSATGLPMYLGEDGSIPTGQAPDIFLTGETENWHTNKGAGGGFTENGEITYSSSRPGENIDPLDNGLKGYWKLDETSGTTAVDSASGWDGTWSGGTPATIASGTGKINTGFDFDGNQDYVVTPSVAGNTDLHNGGFTASAWINPRGTGDNQIGRIIAKHAPGSGNEGWNLHVASANGGQYKITFNAGFSTTNGNWDTNDPSNNNLDLNEWHHVAVTYDCSNTANDPVIYIDGISWPLNENSTPAGTCLSDTAEPLSIGAKNTGSRSFNGILDDVRLYDRILSPYEISLLASSCMPDMKGVMKYDESYNVMEYCNGVEWVAMGPVGGTLPTNGLKGWWKLDETSGTSITDYSGQANTGTATAAIESINGQVDTAIRITKSAPYRINFGGANPDFDMSGTNAFTISAWIKPENLSDNNQVIFSKGNFDNSAADISYDFRQYNTSLRLQISDGATLNTQFASNAVSTYLGKWVYVTTSWNGTDMRFYVNGVLVTTKNIGTFSLADNTTATSIGEIGTSDTYAGGIDDVMVYNRALSDAEVSQLYHYGLSHGLGDISNTCTDEGPITGATAEGLIFYNSDFSVMQYCNGENWIGIGQ